MTTVCCEPCQKLGVCQPKHNCCLECHFSFEEEVALPHLPPPIQALILQEHREIAAGGFQAEAVERHAAWEEAIFRLYVPPDICALIERDHQAHGHGDLHSRDPSNWRANWT